MDTSFRTRIVTVATIVGALALTGCSATAQPAPAAVTVTAAPVTVAPAPVADSTAAREASYLSLWQEKWPGTPTDQAITIGHGICQMLQAGSSTIEVVDHIMTIGHFSAYDAGYMVGLATTTYCPEQMGTSTP